jgi:hypothetical protein
MSNLSSSFIFQMDMIKRLEDMFWTGSGHVLKTCPSAKMSYFSRTQISPMSVMLLSDEPKRTSGLTRQNYLITNGGILQEPIQIIGITPTKWSKAVSVWPASLQCRSRTVCFN